MRAIDLEADNAAARCSRVTCVRIYVRRTSCLHTLFGRGCSTAGADGLMCVCATTRPEHFPEPLRERTEQELVHCDLRPGTNRKTICTPGTGERRDSELSSATKKGTRMTPNQASSVECVPRPHEALTVPSWKRPGRSRPHGGHCSRYSHNTDMSAITLSSVPYRHLPLFLLPRGPYFTR